MKIPQDLKIEISFDSGISLLGILPKNLKTSYHSSAHVSVFIAAQFILLLEMTFMFIDRGINNEDAIFIYNRSVFY